MKVLFSTLLGLLMHQQILFAQNVGIGTTSPHASAQLEITSTTKGLLVPRMRTSNLGLINNPAKGLMIYDSTRNQLMVNMGTAGVPNWQTVVFNSGWSLTGNIGASPSSHFIGTLDSNAISFRQNNKWTGKVDAITGNYFIGAGAGQNNTGTRSVIIGDSAGFKPDGAGNNVIIGADAGKNNTGSWTTLIGFEAGKNNASWGSVFIGSAAGESNKFGYNNTYVGDNAGRNDSVSSSNSIFGSFSGSFSKGSENTFIGASSGYSNTGNSNTFLGVGTGYSNATSGNTFIGYHSGFQNISGTSNTFAGFRSGVSSTGSFNTFLGHSAGSASSNSGTHNTYIGAEAGKASTSGLKNVGIGTFALAANNTGYHNSVTGYAAMYLNTSGHHNVADGYGALYSNTTGTFNTAIGEHSFFQNISGHNSTAVGGHALHNTTSSQFNTALGFRAGDSHDMGWNNTLIGADAEVNFAGQFNSIAIGNGAVATANSQVRIGNAANTSVGGYGSWTNFSDGRYKSNITDDVKGLGFIMQLRPVNYSLNATGIHQKLHPDFDPGLNHVMKTALEKTNQQIFTGFVAQEVELAARNSGFQFSGVDKPENENGFYGLRYAEFVVPLVKAVQELSRQNEELLKRIEKLEAALKKL